MAYVQPNSRIEFFTDLGISQDYNDTLYFPTVQAKDTYFSNVSNRLAHVDRCYYTRDNRGFVRVELPMYTLIGAQYMRFKNTSYENKWWYAFVEDVIYINDNTTEVKFTLDPMMSWMGSFTLTQCFVERQHSETDAIGDNLVEETLDTGEYVYNGAPVRSGAFNNWKYLITIAPDDNIYPPSGTYLGLYNGLAYRAVDAADMTGTVSDIMDSGALPWVQDETRIQNIQLVPSDFIPDTQHPVAPRSFTVDISKTFDGVGGYGAYGDTNTVKNNKLYTYPYNVLCVYNSEGNTNTYRYERFQQPVGASNVARFYIYGSVGVKTEIACYPINYKGLNDNLGANNYEEQMTIKDFPMCSWTTDTFKAYVAQRLSTLPGTAVAGGGIIAAKASLAPSGEAIAKQFMQEHPGASYETAVGYSTAEVGLNMGKAVGLGLGYIAVKEITAALSAGIAHAVTPYQAHGQSSGDIMSIMGQKDFWFYRKSVSYECAKIIDNYFTMFGYADRSVHVPNMHARSRFTYVKTIACKINCTCPASDADFIEELFNKGIRFWVNHTYIGDYSTPNTVLNPVP